MIDTILEIVKKEYEIVPGIKGIALGGSRATDTALSTSDIDIGLYYDKETLDHELLNYIAKELDDEHRDNLIGKEGDWGSWVNFGGWLTINGANVDLIFRDIKRVEAIVNNTDKGIISAHYQTGHPHAYINVMYRGELAESKILYGDDDFIALKSKAEIYPEQLQKAIIDFFLFESKFSLMFVKENYKTEDCYYVAGHMFRSISALNQVLFAYNEVWCLNEKKAITRIDSFKDKPENYSQRVNAIFKKMNPESVSSLEALCDEVEELVTH